MAATDKDTIYIDIDDEITGIIDKLKSSDGKIVALVLPKRATVFQSIVNMKLLKRAADSSKKHLVLITSEAGLLPLAGLAGVHVAKTLTSKPEIPAGPALDAPDAEETIDEDSGDLNDELPAEAAAMPVGALAGKAKPPTDDNGVETLSLDDDTEEADALLPVAPKTFDPPGKGKDAKKPKKNKKLAVPNFEKFRLLLILGVLLLIFGIGGTVYAVVKLPKATINIQTDATNVDTNLTLNLSTAATTLKESTTTVPAKLASQQKSNTQQVTSTGQKNNGNRASGEIKLTNCTKRDGDITLPSGSSFSSGGNTYITQESVVIPESSFNNSGTKCTSSATETVAILAQSGGTAFNGANSFSAGSPYTGLTGTGSTSGGTDNIVQTVTATDIANVKSKLTASDSNLKQTLENQLKQDGYRAIVASYQVGTPAITVTANAGDVATMVSATSTTTYSMFGVRDGDLKTLVENDIKKKIDVTKQSILNNGVSGAAFTVVNQTATGAQVTMETTATAGPDLDVDSIRADAAGKKPAEIRESLQNNPDVKSVDVKLSPFFVSSVPKKSERIIVNIAKPTSTKPATTNVDNP